MQVPVDGRTGKPKITNEMKTECIGEFTVPVQITCNCENPDLCDVCEGDNFYTYHAGIPWTTMKEIYKKMAEVAARSCR